MQKTAVITGGTGGLGRAVVSRLASDGYHVRLSALNDDEARGYDGPGEIGVVSLDNLDQVRPWAAEVGEIDCLVCIAGGFSMQQLADASAEDFDHLMNMNLRTTANCLSAFGANIHDGGAAVLFGAEVYEGAAGKAIYAASKAGVVSLARSAALEWQKRRIRVNSILPNTIDTPANRNAMPNANFDDWAKPEEIADVVAFLVSDKAAVVSGNAIRVGRTV